MSAMFENDYLPTGLPATACLGRYKSQNRFNKFLVRTVLWYLPIW